MKMGKQHSYKHPKPVHQRKKKSFKQPKPVRQQKKKSPKRRLRLKKSRPQMMKLIEGRRNKHKGEEIWILGCGPSLDDFPDDFFDSKNRIAIACKWSMVAFPNCTYSAFSRSDQELTNYVLANRRHLLRSHIVHLRPKGIGAVPIGQKPIYMKVSTRQRGEDYYRSLPKYLLRGTPILYYATGTLIHWDIQAAIIMGAKKITLVGCESRTNKFQKHALKRGMDKVYGPKAQILGELFRALETPPLGGYPKEYREGRAEFYPKERIGVFWLAKHFAPHGIQIARYYYGKGYEKIV